MNQAHKPNVRIVTSYGTITAELYPDKAPLTAQHFLRYIRHGLYDNNLFQRVIDNFITQGSERESGLIKKPTRSRIRKEARRALLNARGTIAMTRSPEDPYAFPILFVNIRDNPSLDVSNRSAHGWSYCAFGKITDGIEVLDRIAGVDSNSKTKRKDVPKREMTIETLQLLRPDRATAAGARGHGRGVQQHGPKRDVVVQSVQLLHAEQPTASGGSDEGPNAAALDATNSAVTDTFPQLLHSATPDEFLPSRTWWPKVGGLVLLAVVMGLAVLAGVLEYRVTVDAHATVRPVGELRVVEATSDGTVRGILVEQNQQVEQGSIIAHVDDSRLQTKRTQIQGAIAKGVEQLQQIGAQLAALDRQIEAEKDLLTRGLSAAESKLSLIHRRHRERSQTAVAEVDEATALLDFAREEYSRYATLAPQGVVSEIELKERESNLRSAEARLARARTSLNPSKAEIEIAKDGIVQARASRDATMAKFSKEREILLQRQAEVRAELTGNKEELGQLDTEIGRSVIRAPVSGVIQLLTLRNPGQVVNAGELVARIAPRDSLMEVKALVALRDIGKVEVGQTVHVRLSACPFPDYGTLRGMVMAVSPDAIAPEQIVREQPPADGGPWTGYEVTVRPDTLTLKHSGRECLIQAGMEGQAEILSKKQTILRFFLGKARLVTDV